MSTYISHTPPSRPAEPPSERGIHPLAEGDLPSGPQDLASDQRVLSEPQAQASGKPNEPDAPIDVLDSPAESESITDSSDHLDESESQIAAARLELPALQTNEDPVVQHELQQRIDRYVNAFEKVVGRFVRVEKDTVEILEEAYGLWSMCRLNEQAKAGFMEECRRINLKVSDKAGEFILYLRFVQPYWEKVRQPSKEAREAARRLVNSNNRNATALTGLKIHLLRRYGELLPYVDGTVTELLTNRNTEFGSIEAAVRYAREQLRQQSESPILANAGTRAQQDEPKREMLIIEAERDIASLLHRKKHNSVELSLKTWRNGQPISYRVVSTSSQEIQTLGVSPSTPEEEEAFISQSKD